MKTRTKLQITVIAMIIETFLLAIKQPVLYNINHIAHFDEGLATTIIIYYTYLYKWTKILCYGFFVFFILTMEKEYKHKIFGHFFIADFLICVADATIVAILMSAEELSTDVRHYTEIAVALATCFTSFFAGTFLYIKVHSPAFKKVRLAYRLWALRYFVYALILIVEVVVHNWKNIGYMQMGATMSWVFISWFLRMPLLVVSRVILLRGVMLIKTAKEQHEDHKARGVSHHHHHHHHHHHKEEEEEQTIDS